MGKKDEGIRPEFEAQDETDLGERGKCGIGVSSRSINGDVHDMRVHLRSGSVIKDNSSGAALSGQIGSKCIHGLLQSACALCLGYPQSNHVGSGPPGWVKG
jgi:hypothetical protein